MSSENQCQKCEYAEISASGKVIHIGNTTAIQNGTMNVICKCPHFVKNISIIDGKLLCSSYKERSEEE